MNPKAIIAPLFDLNRRRKRRRADSGAAAMMSASSAADGRSANSGMSSTTVGIGCSIIGILLSPGSVVRSSARSLAHRTRTFGLR